MERVPSRSGTRANLNPIARGAYTLHTILSFDTGFLTNVLGVERTTNFGFMKLNEFRTTFGMALSASSQT